MAEAMESPDPQQRARWYEYRSRLSSPNPEPEGPVNLCIIDTIDEETLEEDADDEEEEEGDISDEEEEEEEDFEEEEEEDSDEEKEQEEDSDEEREENAEDNSSQGVWRSLSRRRLQKRCAIR
jgi:hypothetical protein